MAFYSENIQVRALELFLAELIIFVILWLSHSFLATYLTIIFSVIFFFIFIISVLAELVERSKVPRFYFYAMIVSFITPWIATAIALFFLDIDWGLAAIKQD